jgi:hypothetical protein
MRFGLICFAFMGTGTSLVVVLINLAIIGVGFGLFSTPNTHAIMSLAGPGDFGVASAFMATMRNLGMVSAMGIIAVIVSGQLGQMTIAAAPSALLVTTLRWCFAVFAGICLVGIVASLNRRSCPDPLQ